MDQIAVACALEYTKFRFTDKWTKDCVILDKWLKIFNQKRFYEKYNSKRERLINRNKTLELFSNLTN